MYTFQSRVRYSELDADRKMSIAAVVDYFQDCSTFQSEDLGVGLDYMDSLGQVWLMSYWQIVIDRYPKLCENITVGTFPYEFRGFMGLRNFFMDDEEGNRIIRANSVWSLMDRKAGRPAKPSDAMVKAYRLEEKLDMKYEPRKIALTGTGTEQPSFTVGRQHLDSNGHVNNGQYIYMAQDYLPPDFEIGQMRAEYRKSALLHDRVVPVVYTQDTQVGVALCGGDGAPYAIVEFRKK